jgi:hypothetical protein
MNHRGNDQRRCHHECEFQRILPLLLFTYRARCQLAARCFVLHRPIQLSCERQEYEGRYVPALAGFDTREDETDD